MPSIYDYHCTNSTCEFEMPSGWGHHMYAITDEGKRLQCLHPGGMEQARQVIGEDASPDEINQRTGIVTYCFCLDCETQVDLDLDRDGKACPECQSNAIKTIDELVDEQCPVCAMGTIIAEDTGWIA